MCLTASFLATGGFVKLFHKIQWFLATGGFVKYFTKFNDFSTIIQVFSNSMIFPGMQISLWFCECFIISIACGNPVCSTQVLYWLKEKPPPPTHQLWCRWLWYIPDPTEWFCLFCCLTSQSTAMVMRGTVTSPNHTFSWASLNKRLTGNFCIYFRL